MKDMDLASKDAKDAQGKINKAKMDITSHETEIVTIEKQRKLTPDDLIDESAGWDRTIVADKSDVTTGDTSQAGKDGDDGGSGAGAKKKKVVAAPPPPPGGVGPRRDPSKPTEEQESSDYGQFMTDQKSLMEKYASMARADPRDIRDFVGKHHKVLLGDKATGWLLLKALGYEMAGDTAGMKEAVRMYMILQCAIDLAKAMKCEPTHVLGRVFQKFVQADPAYMAGFNRECEEFSQKIAKRAVEKAKEEAEKEPEYEYVEVSREERLGPGGLDPVEVMQELPQSMQDAFEKKDIPMLHKALKDLPEDKVDHYMKLCRDSGLWVDQGNP